MKKLFPILIMLLFVFGCGKGEEKAAGTASEDAGKGVTVEYTAPEPLEVPQAKTPKSEDDWEARVRNKEIEVIQLLNIINPIAAYITAGFEQYGSQIKN